MDGWLYNMAPPGLTHQRLVLQFSKVIDDYIKSQNGQCEVIPAPFAVNLNADDKTYVEPDISVVCDRSKRTERVCIYERFTININRFLHSEQAD